MSDEPVENPGQSNAEDVEVNGLVFVQGSDGKTYASGAAKSIFTRAVPPLYPATIYVKCSVMPSRTVLSGARYTISIQGQNPDFWPGNTGWNCTVDGPRDQRSTFTHP